MTDTPIEVLRVEQNVVSKELLRFRPCDTETRSMYCREWAQYVYKRHFVWNAKTQEDIAPPPETIQAGPYTLKLLDNQDELQVDYEKLKSVQWIQQMENELEKENLLDRMVIACRQWILSASSHAGLPDIFQPLELSSYPDAIPLMDDASQLLDPLIIERQALCLPSDCFHLLKNLTGDIILSHTTPICEHRKPLAKTPVDLDVDRAILAEHEQVAVQRALKELSGALERVWLPLNTFLERLEHLEKLRSQFMGRDCQASIDAYVARQGYVPFVDYWTKQGADWKKKKSSEEEVKRLDLLVQEHFGHLVALVDQFMNEFVKTRFADIRDWKTELFKTAEPMMKDLKGPSMGDKKEPMSTIEQFKNSFRVDTSDKRIIQELDKRISEFKQEVQDLIKTYQEASKPILASRMDKLNNKDFKKKVKKVESGYYTLRQFFRYEITENIFPETLFGRFILVCLSPLMMKGEIMEVVAIKEEVQRFVESHKELLKERFVLLSRFEEGVQTGRKELAGVIGKLLLKEGMRIQGESVALERQNSLLKTFGVSNEPESKKKKNKGKKGSGASTPSVQEEKVLPSAASITQKLTEAKKQEKKSRKEKLKQMINEQVTEPKEAFPELVKKQENLLNEKTSSAPVKPIPVPESIKRAAAAEVESSIAPAKSVPESIKEVKASVMTIKSASVPESIKETPQIKSAIVPQKPAEQVIQKPKEPVVQKPKEPVVQKPKEATTSKPYVNKVAPAPVFDSAHISNKKTVKKPYVSKVASAPILDPPVQKSVSSEKKKNPHPVKKKAPVKEVPIKAAPVEEAKEPIKETTVEEPVSEQKVDEDIKGWADIVASIAKDPVDSWNTEPTTELKMEPTVESTVENSQSSTGGWGAEVTSGSGWGADTVEESTETMKEGWGAENSDWNTDSVKDSWGNTEKADSIKEGWGTENKDWNTATATAVDDSWSSMKQDVKNSSPKWRRKNAANPEWRAFSKPTETKPKEENLGGWESVETENWTSSKEAKKKGWSSLKETNESSSWGNTSNQTNEGWEKNKIPDWENSQASWESRNRLAPSEPVVPQAIPPGLAQEAVPARLPFVEPKEPAQPPGLPFSKPMPSVMNDMFMSNTFVPSMTSKLQEPLPSNIDDFGKDMLLLMVKNVHRENSTLINTVYSLQQDMAMLNKQYSEVMALARERETQTIQLLETRQQTEIEKAKAYVISLESRIKELEGRNQDRTTAGFGNQDLFAGYRDEMKSPTNNYPRNNSRKMWQKAAVVRCGNCGETGHSSSECKSYCRYCGSLEHLSESCPMH